MLNAIFNHWAHIVDTVDLASAISGGEFGVLLLLESGWVLDDHRDDETLAAVLTGPTEFDGAGYSRKALANVAWTKDPAGNRSVLTADPTVWNALGQGSGPAAVAIVYWDDGLSGDDSLTIPIAAFGGGGFPKHGTGRPFTITWDATNGLYTQGTSES